MNVAAELRALEIVVPRWDDAKRDLVEKSINPTVFERDGRVLVSGECGDGLIDFYGEFRGGYPYIHPELEKFAKAHKGYWEWENPGAISFVEN